MSNLPQHVVVVMDGNGRWAKQRSLPRVMGHKAGVKATHALIQACGQLHIPSLTLFAFGLENQNRPTPEVNALMELFAESLKYYLQELHQQNVCFKVIGDYRQAGPRVIKVIEEAEELTAKNTGLQLNVAFYYSGRWDLLQGMKTLTAKVQQGELSLNGLNEELLSHHLALAGQPAPDLFIRTSGEQRLSNFLLWQLAYTELYFSDCYWPDFDRAEFDKALAFYANRERRFGKTSEQLCEQES